MTLQKPKGTLIAIGNNENREDILRRIITETGKIDPKVCLFTLAANKPDLTKQEYKTALKNLGIHDLSVINFNSHIEADSFENLETVKNTDLIIFSDGSQLKLSSLLGGTHLLARIKKRYYNEPDFVVTGMGAAASVLSNTVIISCISNDAMLKGELELINGFNLINSVFIDTHYARQGRYGCLIQTVTFNPAALGIGLSENTAVVIKNEEVEVIGSGLVTIVDGTTIGYTDLTDIADGDPITVEGIRMHFLSAGKCFDINEKQIQKQYHYMDA